MIQRNFIALVFFAGLGACSDAKLEVTPANSALQQAAEQQQLLQAPVRAGGSDMNATDLKTTKMQATDLYQQIKTLVGDANASNAGFCRKVGLGHRPCGGPESYLVYSAEGIDEPKLLALIAQYGSLRKAEHEASGMMSTCEMIPEPSVVWVGGQCKLGAAGGGDAI